MHLVLDAPFLPPSYNHILSKIRKTLVFIPLNSLQWRNMGEKENQELKFIIIEMENDFVSLELFVQFYSDAIVWKFVNDVACA